MAAGLAVLSAVSAALPPEPPTVAVVVARSQLRGGVALTADDLEVRRMTVDDAPQGFLGEVATLTGRTLAAPVAQGQVLTGLALVRAGPAVGPGNVVAPLRLADAGVVALLQAGDRLDVLGADEQAGRARVVARSVRVVSIPVAGEDAGETSGALVLVEVAPAVATDLVQAAAVGPLTVTWR